MPSSRAVTRARDERGLVLPSPVVMLSIVAVVMAAVAFVATRDTPPAEREITTIAKQPTATPTPSVKPTKKPAKKPPVQRGKVPVEVYNNSGITGLAGRVATRAGRIGWQVVGSDNWYGTVDATTVYYPKRLKAAAKQLALDLGIRRTAPAVEPMRLDRLTLILTGPLT
ncbi:LytR C-terminal domain-containing protein [Nocardioides dilutus]